MKQPKIQKQHEFRLPMGVLSVSVSPDNQTIVAACLDGVYRCNVDGTQRNKLYQHDSYVSSVEFIGDSTIVSAGYDGRVIWFDLANEETVRSLQLHKFWSWDMAVSPDRKLFASVTGQYIAGGYKYEPKQETEPSLKLVSVETGQIVHELSHVPSVQAVAFSDDGKFVAAANIMGEVRVFDVGNGKQITSFSTPDFTSWGIIKSHSYLGGIFALKFTPQHDLLMTGMGPMRDPMAGNGRQLWQKWSWKEGEPNKQDETHYAETGTGLMETLAIHPSGEHFLMGGRLRDGELNVAWFDLKSGSRVAKEKLGYRITDACYFADGGQLILAGASGKQPGNKKKDGTWEETGLIQRFTLS